MRGNDTNVVDNPMAIILNLCVDTLQQVEGFNNYADFQQGMTQINGVIAHGRQQVADRCQRFAQNIKMKSSSISSPAELLMAMLMVLLSAH